MLEIYDEALSPSVCGFNLINVLLVVMVPHSTKTLRYGSYEEHVAGTHHPAVS